MSQFRDLALQLRNEGNDVLTVNGASFTNPAFALVGATFPITLGNRGVANLTVRFAPPDECLPCAGDVVFTSNDPDEGEFHVGLTGIGLIPPEASVDPTSLHAATATTLGPTRSPRPSRCACSAPVAAISTGTRTRRSRSCRRRST